MSTGFFNELWVSKILILNGIYMCILVSFIAIIIGTIMGVFVGLALTYGNTLTRFLARVYVDVIRGIPVLVLILTIYFVLPAIQINFTALQAGITSLAVFSSAQVAEMLRGGLQNIPKGQTEAAKAVGLGFSQTFVFVSLPQALRQVLPTWVNTAVETVKGSTLVSLVGVVEITLVTQQIIGRNFLTMQFYALAGLIYFIICFSIERGGKFVEKKVAIK
jgi:polar amino acid transport system permease protein